MKYANLIIPFAGGLGMFIYGMQIMAQGLENAAGNKMKSLLEVLTKNKLMGVLLGAFITAVIQSSSATSVMVVGFVNAGIMNLSQAIGVLMGANVGTTVTGWLVSAGEWAKFLKPSTLAPIAIMAGVVLMLTGKRRSTKDVSSIVVGFGLLFIGISTMSDAVSPLKDSGGFRNLFVTLGGNPILGIIVGALVTAVIQSSSASVGILQSLAAAGLVPFSAAIYIIMGQNIGTCITAMLSGIGAKKNAKTAALMHLLFNVIGTAIFSVSAIVFFRTVNPSWANSSITQTQISGVHTLFNVVTTILLFPFAGVLVRLAKKLAKVEKENENVNVISLDDRMLETPGIALSATLSEVERMGVLVKDTLDVARRVLFTQSEEDIRLLRDDENEVDRMYAGITDYVVKIAKLQISQKEHEIIAKLIQVISDIERVGDYCENISEFAEQMAEHKLSFTENGARELKEMIEVCADSYDYAIRALVEQDKKKAQIVLEKETLADELEVRFRSNHIKRLTAHECQTEAGIIFLDTMVCLERISDHARNIAEEVLKL